MLALGIADRLWKSPYTKATTYFSVTLALSDIEKYRVMEIKKRVRSTINERDDEQYRTNIHGVESRGLAEIENPRHVIATPAGNRLEHLFADMPGGSIGISGPRGAGKSSLIRASCPSGDNQPEGILGVIVSAPVQFDARDFVLHLFAEICRTIIGPTAVDVLRSPDPFFRRRSGGSNPLVLLRAVSPVILLVGVGMLIVELTNFEPSLMWATVVTIVGVYACLPGVYGSVGRRGFQGGHSEYLVESAEGRVRSTRFGDETVRLARQRLTDIWFQQSFTSGWSGSVDLPIGVSGGLEGGRELARQQMSMPDIVGELRRLVSTVASRADDRRRHSSFSSSVSDAGPMQVRIGIDELDKIDSIDDASRFMNEIKVLFGVPDCVFLVSISEDAMSQFERRGLPIRDTFDSSFDAVVRVEPLAASGSVALLRERIVGMPIPFILLCHSMGGGLPREVIRLARELLLGDKPARQLSSATTNLTASQVLSKIDATSVAARRHSPLPALDDLQGWLEDLRKRPTDSMSLLEVCHRSDPALRTLLLSRSDGDGSSSLVANLTHELLAYLYFCATIQDFFVDERSAEEYRVATWGDSSAPAMADAFARAHQAFAIHPRAAWTAITEIREQLGVAPAPSPEGESSPAGSTGGLSRLAFARRSMVQRLRGVGAQLR